MEATQCYQIMHTRVTTIRCSMISDRENYCWIVWVFMVEGSVQCIKDTPDVPSINNASGGGTWLDTFVLGNSIVPMRDLTVASSNKD